jgi:hypothetical protein
MGNLTVSSPSSNSTPNVSSSATFKPPTTVSVAVPIVLVGVFLIALVVYVAIFVVRQMRKTDQRAEGPSMSTFDGPECRFSEIEKLRSRWRNSIKSQNARLSNNGQRNQGKGKVATPHSRLSKSFGTSFLSKVKSYLIDLRCGSAICLEDLSQTEDVRGLPCYHVFHSECLRHCFLRRNFACPLCNAPYYDVVKAEATEVTSYERGSTV